MTPNVAALPTMAADLGFMSREGLDVKIVQFDGSPQALAAIEKGEVQMGLVNIAPVVEGVAKGVGLRIVWAMVHGDPFKPTAPVSPDAGLILVASRSFSSLDGLSDARIGISQKGATNHHALVPILREHGIDPEKGVIWVEEPGSTPIERMKNLLAGEIDAMVTTSQTLALFEARRGDLKILADGREFARVAGVQFLVGATTKEMVEKEPKAVQSAVNGLIKAARDLSQNSEGWVAGVAKRRPDVPKEAIAKSWEQSKGHWPVNGRLDPSAGDEAAKRLKKSGEISVIPSASSARWVEMRFVDAALKELGKWKE